MNLFEDFLDYLRYVKRYSPHTVLNYSSDLTSLESYLNDYYDVLLPDIAKHHFRSYIVHLKSQNYSARSINRKISSAQSFYKYLLRKNKIKVNPISTVKLLKTPKRLPSYVTESKISSHLDIPINQDFGNLRDYLIIYLLYFTGMRRSELINIKRSDIDSKKKAIKVLGKGNKERFVLINDALIELINKYYNAISEEFEDYDTTFIILTDKGRQAYPRLIYVVVNTFIKKYNLSDKQSPHVLRHTFATHLLNNGADINAVKELLGHKSLSATQVYTHNSIEKLKLAYQNAHPRS